MNRWRKPRGKPLPPCTVSSQKLFLDNDEESVTASQC